MKNKKTTRFVVMVTALGSMGLLAAMQGCSSSSDDAPADPDSGASSSSNSSSSSTSSSGGPDSGADANKPDANKTDSGTDAGACFDDIRTVDGGADGGTVPCPVGCEAVCDGLNKNAKKDVADAIIKTLVVATDCAAVDADGKRTSVVTKYETAAAKACVDTAVAQFCTNDQVNGAAKCNGTITQAECETFAKGANAAGRTAALTCFNSAGPPYDGCKKCVDGIKSGVDFQ